jgi:hypothetical protein
MLGEWGLEAASKGFVIVSINDKTRIPYKGLFLCTARFMKSSIRMLSISNF